MYSDNQIRLDNTIVSFVIQNRQVSEGGAISVPRHVNCLILKMLSFTFRLWKFDVYFFSLKMFLIKVAMLLNTKFIMQAKYHGYYVLSQGMFKRFPYNSLLLCLCQLLQACLSPHLCLVQVSVQVSPTWGHVMGLAVSHTCPPHPSCMSWNYLHPMKHLSNLIHKQSSVISSSWIIIIITSLFYEKFTINTIYN